MTLLRIENVRAGYGPSVVLHDTCLEVAEGEVVSILGRNGMGKSTLVHVIAGLLRCDAGKVWFDGEDITKTKADYRCRRGLTLVPQGHRVFPSLTVREHLDMALRSGSWTPERVEELFPILGERRKQGASSLSGGQKQMLAFGRALVGNGKLVVMDEPTEGVDPSRTAQMGEAIDELSAEGTAVLLIEQRIFFALNQADQVGFMQRGVIDTSASIEDLRSDPSLSRTMLGLSEETDLFAD